MSPRRGQLSRFEPHLRFLRPHGRIASASASAVIATGRAGYIDGAIEAGITASRQLRALLAAPSTSAIPSLSQIRT